jgi:hypothetical protein
LGARGIGFADCGRAYDRLARATYAHHRVFLNANKTLVFMASPGSYSSNRMG